MKKNKDKKPTFELWEVLVISLIASVIMSMSTGYVVYRSKSENDCSKVSNSEYIGEFVNSYNNILNNYYDDIDQNALVDAAISGMLSYLGDPYTTYLNESSTNVLTDSLLGTYEGVGVEVKTNSENKIEVATVFDDSPAMTAGLLVGDVITKINDTDTTSMSATDAVSIIKKSTDNSITMEVLRGGETKSFELKKQSLYVPAVKAETFEQNNHKVGYLDVSKFSDTVSEQFKKGLNKLEDNNIDSLIIDLRNNTGGYLNGATNIASIFLEKNKTIYSLKNKISTETTKDETEESRNYKVYILLNHGSASASEVLAAAMKYSYGSMIVGETSYGKGKVQKTSNLSDGSMFKYTSAQWLTPNGDCIDGKGITPDFEVVLDESITEYAYATDNQLQTAITEITK